MGVRVSVVVGRVVVVFRGLVLDVVPLAFAYPLGFVVGPPGRTGCLGVAGFGCGFGCCGSGGLGFGLWVITTSS